MSINRPELKAAAKNSLRGKWGISIGVLVIYCLLVGLPNIIPVIGVIAVILISPALALGFTMFFLKLARGEEVGVEILFAGFKKFWKAFGVTFMVGLFTFLWSLLLVIPGIIASFRYCMVYYIMADNPEIGVMAAIEESKKITSGYKWDIFVLYLSFIGWAILATLTFGIGYLWLVPYVQTTLSNLYIKLKDEPIVVNPPQDTVTLE